MHALYLVETATCPARAETVQSSSCTRTSTSLSSRPRRALFTHNMHTALAKGDCICMRVADTVYKPRPGADHAKLKKLHSSFAQMLTSCQQPGFRVPRVRESVSWSQSGHWTPTSGVTFACAVGRTHGGPPRFGQEMEREGGEGSGVQAAGAPSTGRRAPARRPGEAPRQTRQTRRRASLRSSFAALAWMSW